MREAACAQGRSRTGQVDQSADGFIDYEDFLQRFNQVQGKDDVGKDDRLGDDEIFHSILSASMNIAEVFQRMDEKKDGLLSADDLQKGIYICTALGLLHLAPVHVYHLLAVCRLCCHPGSGRGATCACRRLCVQKSAAVVDHARGAVRCGACERIEPGGCITNQG